MTVLMALAFAIGCGGKKPAETTTTNKDTTTTNTDTTTTTATTGEGTPCAQEVALVCADGQVDGCTKTPAEGDTHKCVAK
ncbi:MAG TPA: hypothetical protein VIV11_00065 [Kofleriaceae bacterium]